MADKRFEYLLTFSVLILQSFAAQKHVIKDNPMQKLYEASQAGDKQGFEYIHASTMTHNYARIASKNDRNTVSHKLPCLRPATWSRSVLTFLLSSTRHELVRKQISKRHLVSSRQRCRHQQARSRWRHCTDACGFRAASSSGRGPTIARTHAARD